VGGDRGRGSDAAKDRQEWVVCVVGDVKAQRTRARSRRRRIVEEEFGGFFLDSRSEKKCDVVG